MEKVRALLQAFPLHLCSYPPHHFYYRDLTNYGSLAPRSAVQMDPNIYLRQLSLWD